MFEEERRQIADLLARTKDPRGVERAGAALASYLEIHAPKDTGTLSEALTATSRRAEEEAYGLSFGVGDARRTGSASDPPERGLIAQFLEANPKYRRGGKWMEGFEPRLAWWFLPREGKKALHEERRGGTYGGPMYFAGAPTRYYFAQSGEKETWESSAEGAGISPTGFTEEALTAWRENLPWLVGNFLRRG